MILASYCIKIFSANDAIQFWPIIFLEELKRYGITLESLSSLETVGLLQYGTNIAINIEDGDCIEYFDNRIFSEDIQEKSNISIGGVLLSHTGEALMKIISPTIVEGFFENVVEPVFYRKDIKWERIMYNQDPAKQHSKAENE